MQSVEQQQEQEAFAGSHDRSLPAAQGGLGQLRQLVGGFPNGLSTRCHGIGGPPHLHPAKVRREPYLLPHSLSAEVRQFQ
jgi:hypothetical protein